MNKIIKNYYKYLALSKLIDEVDMFALKFDLLCDLRRTTVMKINKLSIMKWGKLISMEELRLKILEEITK